MHRRLTRAKQLAKHVPLALAFGCGGVELVGVDRATVLMGDASVPVDAAWFDPGPRDAGGHDDRDAPLPFPVWSDPQPPARVPGQFVDVRSPCPSSEPKAGDRCELNAQQCDYPACFGRGQRSWVCVEHSFAPWFDESFLCAPSRPCPASVPTQGGVCSLGIECVYEFWCCKGPSGFQSARCDGRWTVDEPVCVGCADR